MDDATELPPLYSIALHPEGSSADELRVHLDGPCPELARSILAALMPFVSGATPDDLRPSFEHPIPDVRDAAISALARAPSTSQSSGVEPS